MFYMSLLHPFPKDPVLTPSQLDRLSNIFDSAGQVALGAGVFSPLFSGVDRIDIGIVASGVITVSFCWILSIWIAKRKDEQI